MKNKKYLLYLLFLVLQFVFTLNISISQEIKVIKDNEGYGWYLKNYTLPDEIITYRIYDSRKRCVSGATMDAKDYYTITLLPTNVSRGKYVMVLYINPGHYIFTTTFQIN